MILPLSQRAQRIKPSPTLEIDAKAKQMKREGKDVISFGAGEPYFDTPDPIKEAAVKALREGKTKYTPVGGIPELKEAICRKLKRENNLSYTPDEVLVSVGAKHSIHNLFQALVNPGDEVIIPAPYWVSYPDQVLLSDGTPVILPTREENGFRITPAELERAITRRTKIFILNSPSNPTGSAYSRSELAEIAKILVKKGIFCLTDEIYEKIVYDGFRPVSLASLNDEIRSLTVTINGVSKSFAMTGWRMGYAAGPKEIIQAMAKIQGQATSNVNTPTQWACVEALNGPQDYLKGWVEELRKRRDATLERLERIPGLRCLKPQGAFYLFPNVQACPFNSSEELARYLLEKALVAVVPGSAFGMEGYLRLSYSTSLENIQNGMDRIEKALKDLKG